MKAFAELKTDLVFGHLGELRRKGERRPGGNRLTPCGPERVSPDSGVAKGNTLFEKARGLYRNHLTTADATVHIIRSWQH